jgi:AcrR family transcriptional regulator
MEQKERILDAVQELAIATGRLPSILEVAKEVGLTKQGVLHHFPTRAALDAAVVVRAVARVDASMSAAAADGSPAATYLRLSAPDDGDRAAAVVMAAAARRGESLLPPEVRAAPDRWEALIAEEVGDPVRAEVVRLVGDGLFAEALLAGHPPATERVDRLVAHLLSSRHGGAT